MKKLSHCKKPKTKTKKKEKEKIVNQENLSNKSLAKNMVMGWR